MDDLSRDELISLVKQHQAELAPCKEELAGCQAQLQWACCHAHARRKFEALEHLASTPQTIRAPAYFRQLFDLEDQMRPLTDSARHELRQQYLRPVLSAMKTWMDQQLEALLPKHPLRGAIQYMTKRWASLARFLESGAIPLGRVERWRCGLGFGLMSCATSTRTDSIRQET
jgi:hypothetical protein